ncbi:MAG TPA: ABC transporter ATP-binding protein [Patescibacteria group bacterium]|nr:ABC transporter ATP-binding protein [Patescibacteria group bacterium]
MVKAILYLLDKRKKAYIFYTTILFSVLFYSLVPSFVIGKIVDFLTTYKLGMSLLPLYGYVLFLTCATAIIALIRLSVKNRLNNIQSEANYFTRVRGFERLLDFSIKWHDKEDTGSKVQKIQNGTNALGQLQNLLGNDVFVQATSIIGVLLAFLLLKPLFFLYSLIYIGIFVIVQASFYNRMQQMTIEFNKLLEKASGTYYEGLSNVLTIKTLGVKEDFKKNITSREEMTKDYSIKMSRFGTDKWKAFQIVNALAVAGMLLLISNGYLVKAISLGSIIVFFNYFQTLSEALGASTSLIDLLINTKISIARMMPIFWEKSTVKEGLLNFPKIWEQIQIQNGNFSYQETENGIIKDSALENINLAIKKYEKVGIVGQSGSGKSTLAKLLLGLYELNNGTYKIGPTNFYNIKHTEATNEIALVLQDSEMFNLSLQDNITLMREYNDSLFQRAVTIAQLEELIKKLPEGINTFIGEKGYRLSGGERQRIGIARAIYKDPQILVLDEATSSLDTKTESLIQEGLDAHLEKKTVISIAHRISTLKNTDRIIVFDNGRIVEEGTYDSLLKNNKSKFWELNKLQG